MLVLSVAVACLALAVGCLVVAAWLIENRVAALEDAREVER
jgi:hypothetical protein